MIRILILSLLLASGLARAEAVKPTGALVDFSVEASEPVANDMAQASAFYEASATNPGELARQVNAAMARGLALAKPYAGIKTRSGSTWTSPIYGKNGRGIESWRMRSELQFESRDVGSLSELLGKLQTTLAIGQISLMPASETRRKAEEEATRTAIAAFQDKARRIATALGKPYHLRQMNIGNNGRPPIYPMARAAMLQADAAPMPIEAGESTITVNISGQIELQE
jgi:predicted secreted protein